MTESEETRQRDEDTLNERNSVGILLLGHTGCASSPYERGGHPQGLSQRDVERGYRECQYKARLAKGHSFYNQNMPFLFSGEPQSPADHALALQGLSTMNALRDT